MIEFKEMAKIPRWNRSVIVTEKIDGTNASVYIGDDLADHPEKFHHEGKVVRAGSRNRWLSIDTDNFGFAAWVEANKSDLVKLGNGQHFGEWWGQGIQRQYGLTEKRFSLFNTTRWLEAYQAMKNGHENRFPKCCHVVPQLMIAPANELCVPAILESLKATGSLAAPGFMSPEGVVLSHVASGQLFKSTIENDNEGKGKKK
jgi:hypothetical protein